MTTQTRAFSRFIGCDVGKTEIVVFDSHTAQITTIANHPRDLVAFAATLDTTCLVVCEATGGYEAALLSAVVKAEIAAHRADAHRSRRSFARSESSVSPTPSMPVRSRVMAANGRLHCRRWCWRGPIWWQSVPPTATASPHQGLELCEAASRNYWPALTRRSE